jgi:predicted ATP-dependent protease
MVKVIPVATLKDVLDNILMAGPKKEGLLKNLAKFLPRSTLSGNTVNTPASIV